MKNLFQFNPWLNIWLRPRETVRKIVDYNPKYRFILLSAIYGFNYMLQLSQIAGWGKTTSLPFVLIASIVLAIPVGMIMLSFFSLAIFWVGKLLKGKARYLEVRAALSWANVPAIVSIAIWIILMLVFGAMVFTPGFQGSEVAQRVMLIAPLSVWVQIGIGIWSFVILLHGLGEVQGFSAWMALLNMVLMSLILFVIFLVVGFVVSYVAHGVT